MVRGRGSVGILLGAALSGCSANGPLSGEGVERAPIVGGATDSTDTAVFGIFINNMALCTGSLIAPNLVLTARHCVAPLNNGDQPVNCATDTFGTTYPPSGFLVTWDTNLIDGTPSNAVIGATEVRVGTDDTFCGNDVALLILESNVAPSSAPTLEPRVDSMPMTPESFSAIGYGLNSPDDVQGTSAGIRRGLGNLEVGCVGAAECGQASRIRDTEWAANAPVCSGDSGGPALDAEGRVIGVASRSDTECALGLYSSVAAWKDLIVKAGQDAADQGGYDPPEWAAGGATMAAGGASTGGSSMGGSSGSAGKGGGSGTGGASGAGGTAMGGTSNAGTGGDSGTGGSANAGNAGAGGRASGKGGSAGRSSMAGSAGSGVVNPPDAGVPLSGPTLGDECSGACVEPYVCYTSTGEPPGTCVPPCSVTAKCPANYRCSIELGACAPMRTTESSGDDDDTSKSDSGCGCRVTPVSDTTGHAWHAFGALALAAALARRRRTSRA